MGRRKGVAAGKVAVWNGCRHGITQWWCRLSRQTARCSCGRLRAAACCAAQQRRGHLCRHSAAAHQHTAVTPSAQHPPTLSLSLLPGLRRDEVAGQVLQQPGREAFLVLGQAGAEEFGLPSIQFYCSRGLLAKVRSTQRTFRALS